MRRWTGLRSANESNGAVRRQEKHEPGARWYAALVALTHDLSVSLHPTRRGSRPDDLLRANPVRLCTPLPDAMFEIDRHGHERRRRDSSRKSQVHNTALADKWQLPAGSILCVVGSMADRLRALVSELRRLEQCLWRRTKTAQTRSRNAGDSRHVVETHSAVAPPRARLDDLHVQYCAHAGCA